MTTRPKTIFCSWAEAAKISSELRAQGKKVISTNGCFDLIHRGHVEYLNEARALGDVLFIGVNSDESTKRLKGPSRPIHTAEDRGFVLKNLKCVDYVCVFDEDTPLQWLEALHPSIHVKGGDYDIEKLPETVLLRKLGAEVRCLQFVDGYSTTKTIAKASAK